MSGILTRDDVICGIRELITRLRGGGSTATIQIVGGAAIALTIDGDRPATVDVDGPVTPLADVEAFAVQIASERGWSLDGVNNKAEDLSPKTYERVQTLLDEGLPSVPPPSPPDFS